MFDTSSPSGQALNRAEYRDRVLGCWTGKNIGGTLGGPFEGQRQMNDATFYVQDLNGRPAPNDDLDLQLVWLLAAEENGLYRLNERKLGEYWLNFITAPWNEYGVGKANMRAGLPPPLSGACNNERWHASNGAWIRSEIWACLFPGSPDEAAQFAYYDACCDHRGDGIYAEVFTASVESAAFVEADPRALIRLGLARIPETSRVARSVQLACACYDEKRPFVDARNALVKDSEDLGWFQAPANIGFVVLGLLYGEGDFARSVTLANNCGDDTDCTAGTLGALLGILQGRKALPERWTAPIGDGIETCSIDTFGTGGRTVYRPIPRTLGELTDRVAALAEATARENGAIPQFTDAPAAIDAAYRAKLENGEAVKKRVWNRSPYELAFDLPYGQLFCDYEGGPFVEPGQEKRITLGLRDFRAIEKVVAIQLDLPEGWRAVGADACCLNLHCGSSARATLTFIPGEFRGTHTYFPVRVTPCDRAIPYTVNLPWQRRDATVVTWPAESDHAWWDAHNRARSQR